MGVKLTTFVFTFAFTDTDQSDMKRTTEA